MTSLQQLAATLAAQAPPALRPLRSPYGDSIHGSVKAAGVFALSELAEGQGVVSGSCVVERPFRPQKIVADAVIVATHAAPGQPDLVLRHELRSTYADLKWFALVDVKIDGVPIFEDAFARLQGRISLGHLACDSLSSGTSMPDARQRIDIRVSVSKHLRYVVQDRLPLPTGYDKVPKSLAAEIVLHFFGPRVAP